MMNLRVCPEDISSPVRENFINEARRLHLMHQPPRQLTEWRRQRARLLKAIHSAAGSFPQKPPLNIQIHKTRRMNGYQLQNLTYQSRPGMRVTANLYLPNGTGPFPGVLGVHGHWKQGKIAARVQARGHVLAMAGFAVLMVDAFGSGERGTVPGEFEYHGAGLGGMLFNIGETLLGLQVYDNMRGVDLLCSLDCVDADRIGVTGASGGGNQTMWMAAMDDRIKAAVPVVSVGTFESYVTRSNCVCEVLPDGLTFMEEWGALALAAPGALLILNALRDTNPTFAVQEMIRSFNAAREIYRLFDCPDRIAYQAFDTPHGYWPEMMEHTLGWFRRWLKNEGEGRPCPLPEYQPLPEKDCMCFPTGQRPTTVVSIAEYYRKKARQLTSNHLNDKIPIVRAKKIRDLRRVLRMPAALGALRIIEVGTDQHNGLATKRELIFADRAHPPIPLVTITRGAERTKLIRAVVHPAGKQHFENFARLETIATGSNALALTDLGGTGETCYDNVNFQANSFPNHSRAMFWLGRTILGDWATEIILLLKILRRRAGAVELTAFAETGLAAMAASACGAPTRQLRVINIIGTYAVKGVKISNSMATHIPGILHWGDVSMLAAATNCPLEIINPVDAEGKTLNAAQCRRLESEIRRLGQRWNKPAAEIKVFLNRKFTV